MDEKEYLNLLETAYNELPNVLYKKERFEVPQVKGRIIKTRTQITNFKEISKHFSRDENHFFRFMLKEVGVRGDQGFKGDITLHSRFQPAMLNKAVKKYFDIFVSCSHCHSPDTVLDSNNTLKKCNACGHQEVVQKI